MKRANLTVPEKLKMQREGYKFFCEYHKTANCAIGENIGLTCVHAPNHKTREGCRYWKPVHIKRKDELIRLRAENERLREALRRIDGMATTICMKDDAGYGIRAESVMPIYETARAAIAAIRPHIEATERERCAKKILETNWVDADPEEIAAAIRSGSGK